MTVYKEFLKQSRNKGLISERYVFDDGTLFDLSPEASCRLEELKQALGNGNIIDDEVISPEEAQQLLGVYETLDSRNRENFLELTVPQMQGAMVKIQEEGGYVIGARGLEKPATGIYIAPKSEYFIGASSSPTRIIVTKVTGDSVHYVYTSNLRKGITRAQREQKWIFDDLVTKGTETWVKQYGSYHPKLAGSLKNNLAGKKGSLNGKAKLEDWEGVVIDLESTGKSRNFYSAVKSYGIIFGYQEPKGQPERASLETIRANIAAVKRDKNFKFISVKKAPGGVSEAKGGAKGSWISDDFEKAIASKYLNDLRAVAEKRPELGITALIKKGIDGFMVKGKYNSSVPSEEVDTVIDKLADKYEKYRIEGHQQPHQSPLEEASRSLSMIAQEIRRDWKNVNFGAAPYLSAMAGMNKITDSYGFDTGVSVVSYFLSNATSWRGPVAKEIKAELKKMLKTKR